MNRKDSPLPAERGEARGEGHDCFFIRVQPKFHPQLNYFCFIVAPPKSNRKLFITTTTVLPS